MQISNNVNRFHYFVFTVWLIFTVIVGASFIQSRLNLFDPHNRLTDVSGGNLIAEIRSMPQLDGLDFEKLLIHFTSDDCHCEKYSENHKDEITKKAISDGFKVVNIHLQKGGETIIPSTPSTLIVSSLNELLYFGPYSTGLACSESNGLVELALDNYTQGFNSNLILDDATGCYCNL